MGISQWRKMVRKDEILLGHETQRDYNIVAAPDAVDKQEISIPLASEKNYIP